MSARRRHITRGVLPAESEAAFGQKVDQRAKYEGWLTYHTFNSKRSAPGFPDWFAVRAPRIVIAELKAQDAPPRVLVRERPAVALRPDWLQDMAVTHEQASWLEALRAFQDALEMWLPDHADGDDPNVPPLPSFEVFVWRPSDWDQITRVLARDPAARWEDGNGSLP